jgi:uncharacterized protein YgiB involved in biofilm formation
MASANFSHKTFKKNWLSNLLTLSVLAEADIAILKGQRDKAMIYKTLH